MIMSIESLNWYMKPTNLISVLWPMIIVIGCTAPKPLLDRYNTQTQFISRIGNQSIHTIRGFDLDKSSNMYISGTTFGTVEVCDTMYRAGHAGLMMKMSPDLTCTWSKFFNARGDRSTCFLREAFLDKDDFVLVPGICHGSLFIQNAKQFNANGRFQSFITKMDANGNVIWTKLYFLEHEFIITNLIKTAKNTYMGIGIRNDTITVLFEIDALGNLGRTKEFVEKDKIYNNIILERGSKFYQSSIGVRFVSIRELKADWSVDWVHEQDTKCSLLAVKANVGVDVRNGIWISVPFSTEATDFVFGRDTLKGTGLIDSYLTQYVNGEQKYSVHIKGSEDQIVTGFFDGNRRCLSFGLSHGRDFQIGDSTYTGGPGISLIEFNAEKPDKMVFSTFPIVNKERDRITNTGVYFSRNKGKHVYLGGCIIKGESQTTNPTMTVGDDTLTIVNPVFNSFFVKGTKKRG